MTAFLDQEGYTCKHKPEYKMELLTPREHTLVTRYSQQRPAEVSYILAIRTLIRATETSTGICAEALSLFNELRAMLDDEESVDLGSDYHDARLGVLKIDLKKIARVGQDLLNARNDLLLGLSAAHGHQDESWFFSKAQMMRDLVDLYARDIAERSKLLGELQALHARVWLAVSHSKMIHCRLYAK